MYFYVFGNEEWPSSLWPEVYVMESSLSALLATNHDKLDFTKQDEMDSWIIAKLKREPYGQNIRRHCCPDFVKVFIRVISPVLFLQLERIHASSENELVFGSKSLLHPNHEMIRACSLRSPVFKEFITIYNK